MAAIACLARPGGSCFAPSMRAHPRTAFKGVRSSCDTVARNSSLRWFACSASSVIVCARIVPTIKRSLASRIWATSSSNSDLACGASSRARTASSRRVDVSSRRPTASSRASAASSRRVTVSSRAATAPSRFLTAAVLSPAVTPWLSGAPRPPACSPSRRDGSSAAACSLSGVGRVGAWSWPDGCRFIPRCDGLFADVCRVSRTHRRVGCRPRRRRGFWPSVSDEPLGIDSGLPVSKPSYPPSVSPMTIPSSVISNLRRFLL